MCLYAFACVCACVCSSQRSGYGLVVYSQKLGNLYSNQLNDLSMTIFAIWAQMLIGIHMTSYSYDGMIFTWII